MLSKNYKTINKSMRTSIPKSKPKLVDKNNLWWNNKLKQMRRAVAKSYKAHKRSPSEETSNTFKDRQRLYKKECEKARLKSWRDLQTNINDISDMNKIIPFNKATPLKPTPIKPNRIQKATMENWDDNIITEEKVTIAFKTFQVKKSPGVDGIHPLILQQLPADTITYITKLYKICVLLGYTPTRWKECKIVFIPKPGKGSYQTAKAWRPISLTNYLLKALEKLCCWHMDEKIELNPIHTRQHGFRTDRNTDISISNVVNYIECHIHREQHVLAVFLDIQAAFDTIDPKQVKEALMTHGGDPTLVKWYYNYITHRNLHIEVKGSQAKLSTSTGFPQGGVCSAKFWIVAFNEAIQILNTQGVYGNGFADDCVALIGGTNTEQMMSRMQKVVNTLEKWGQEMGLAFNALKTEVIMFSKATSINKHLPNRLKIGDHRVPFEFRAKYLGITLDSKLTWQPHINNAMTRAKQYLYTLRKAVSKKWGPKPKYLKWAYNAIVLPRLTHGCLAWGNAITQKTMIQKINSINRLAAGMLSNTRHSTPRAALEVMYNLPPIPLVIKREAMSSFIRNKEALKTVNKGTSDKSHLQKWERLAKAWQLNEENSDRTSYNTWEKLYKVNEKSYKSITEPMKAQINIYTDGSKTDEHTGCGFTISRYNTEIAADSIRLPDYTTVYQAEVLAIRLAMIEVRQHLTEEDRYVKIFSDSQAALKSLAKNKIKSHVVGQTLREFNITGALTDRLQLDWIKAHSNHEGNERADELARNSVYVSNVFFDIQPPMSLFKKEISTRIREEWTNEWQTKNRGS